MSEIQVKDRGNHKTSIWFEVCNKGKSNVDVSASHIVNTKSEQLRIGFDKPRKFPSQIIEIDPDETILIRIAPPSGKKSWKSGQIIKIIFSYKDNTYERLYSTGTQHKIGRFISNYNQLIESSLSNNEQEDSQEDQSQDEEPDNIENPENLESQENQANDLRQFSDPEHQDRKNQEDDEIPSIQQMHETLEHYSKLRAKVNDGNVRLTELQKKYEEIKKRMLDSVIELQNEANEIKEASEICEHFEQQFKKIKHTIDKK